MSTSRTQVTAMLNAALEMEERGFDFYRQAVETCRDEAAREVFRTLQTDEAVHAKRIRAIAASLEDRGAFGDEWRSQSVSHVDLTGLFRGLAGRRDAAAARAEASDLEALDVGIALETRSIRFYEDHLAQATDEAERRFLEAMIGEERSHHQALRDTRLYLTDPAAWYAAHEGTHADGG